MDSLLVSYKNITRQQGGKRQNRIIGITPHYMADGDNWTAANCADYFAQSGRQASCNYCVGKDGSYAISVPEDCHPWTSSNWENDDTHVTFEISDKNNDSGEIRETVYDAFIKLAADVCKRNNINPHYDGTVNGGITMHKMFASTSCPGAWLEKKIVSGQMEKDIKAAMGVNPAVGVQPQVDNKILYRVRKSWDDAKSQLGAYNKLDNAKKVADEHPGFKVYDQSGKEVYAGKSSKNAYVWDFNAILKVGDHVISKSCHLAPYGNTNSAIVGDCVNVPSLGGLCRLIDLDEAGDTKDGKCDGYLANLDARVTLSECVVEAVDPIANLVKVHGYWIKPGPLAAKR